MNEFNINSNDDIDPLLFLIDIVSFYIMKPLLLLLLFVDL